jgi:hypothetical protein
VFDQFPKANAMLFFGWLQQWGRKTGGALIHGAKPTSCEIPLLSSIVPRYAKYMNALRPFGRAKEQERRPQARANCDDDLACVRLNSLIESE